MRLRRIKRYGWVPDLPNREDRVFSMPGRIQLPDAVDLEFEMSPVYNQSELGSCVGNATAAAFDFDRKRQGQEFMSPSRLMIYYGARAFEGSIEYDSGASIRDGIKSVVKIGVCPEELWPYDITKFAEQPSAEAYAAAESNQAVQYRRVSNSEIDMMAVLAAGFPFVFGFSVFDAFESDEVARSGMLSMPGPDEEVIGGHAVCCVGYDRPKALFKVRNSWGEGWGIKGHFWMPFDYLISQQLADDRWLISKVE